MRNGAGEAIMLMNWCIRCGSDKVQDNQCLVCNYRPDRVDGFDAYALELVPGNDGFDPEQHCLLAQFEAGNFWFRARNQLVVHMICRFCPKMSSFLEIGCGTGFVLSAIRSSFQHARVVGSELFVEGLRFASERVPESYLLQMDARSIPYASCFDAVGAFDVIEHIEDDRKVLSELYRALTCDGLLFLTVPQHRWLWSAQDEIAHHVRRYTKEELVQKVGDAGFKVRWVGSFVTLLLPLMVLARKSAHDETAHADPTREFRMPRLLNQCLYAVMKCELMLIKLGIRLPVGGSLMLVASKE